MAHLRKKKFFSGLLSLYSWTLAISGAILSQELKQYDPISTFLMVSIHTALAGFTSVYSGFCICNVDLMDPDCYPFMYSFFVCITGLSIPTGFGIVVLLVILIQKNHPMMSLTSEIYIFVACGSWAIAAVGLTLYMVISKLRAVLDQRKGRKSKKKFEEGVQILQQLMGVGKRDIRLFVRTFDHIPDPNSLLSKLEIWYLTESLKLQLGHSTISKTQRGKEDHSIGLPLGFGASRLSNPEECIICQSGLRAKSQSLARSLEVEFAHPQSGQETERGIIAGSQTEETSAIVMPGCQHVFHTECISRWLELSLFCPLCKTNTRTGLLEHAKKRLKAVRRTGHSRVSDVRLLRN